MDFENDLEELSKLFESDTLEEPANVHEPCDQPGTVRSKKVNKTPAKSIIEHPKFHTKSEIHNGDTDSSDDEDNKYTENQTYTEAGRTIKNVLKKQSNSSTNYFESPSWKTKKTTLASLSSSPPVLPKTAASKDIYSDPFFGIRIINPLVSSQVLQERMVGKTPVTFSKLVKHIQTGEKSSDWVLAGVIVSKFIKTSQKGNPYACWTLSDLREGLTTVSVFLFGKAYKELWKTSTHIVVGILNATLLDNKESSRDIAALSVLNPDQIMIWGQSKDLGVCKARKKNGEPCTSFVNKNQCEFCVYHVKQEYRKFTGRAELQASWGGGLNELKNKVLGKNEVFYGGKSFTAVKSKPNRKQIAKDKTRLSQLFNKCESRFGPESLPMAKPSSQVQSARVQLMKDAERLQKLTGSPATRSALTLEGLGMPKKEEKQSGSPKYSANSLLAKGKPEIKKEISGPLHKHFSGLNDSDNKLKEEKLRSKPINIVEKLKEKRLLDSANESRTKSKSDNVISSPLSDPQHQPKTPTGKKLPSKNRFESLTKLSSVHSKTSESSNVNKINSQVTPKRQKPEKASMLDVSFEFDNESENKIFTSTPDKTNLTSQFKTNNSSAGKCVIDSLQSDKGKRQSRVPVLTPNTNSKSPSEKTQTSPLCERKPPSKYESMLNTRCDTNNQKLTDKVGSVKKTDKDLTSPEYSKKRMQDIVHTNSPKLSEFGSLSLSVPIRSSSAKMKALKYVKLNGPIKKEDPSAKKDKVELNQEKKRKRTDDEDGDRGEKSQLSQRFIELMNASSKHEDLITNAENQAIDDYYDKMEKKEKMEEKMLTTYKMDCKAFRCLKCKYKWFSPSELCKAEKHPIKVISAVKRFFECHNCRNRTVSLEVIPLHNCKNCGQANWKRAAMMRERKSATVHLSIRGGEQTFMNSVVTDTNLDLLVPDS
ncbi:protein MCM10 homolog isoform X2 [Homalodisca vitripennis]|uniref:protein MCM10 homolog isoform X2 n=1 Tax=Homalodisca vitripennis TaxID=197043 RepID=UPI001EE9E7C2|nr:protein MCM10 homolog isoform X2 [Homalodisca vitripennis]